MSETVKAAGMVLSAMPVGDYDKRLVILTRERGKITAFARGGQAAHQRPAGGLQSFCHGGIFPY